jgi:hypothetical protein
MYHQPCTSTCTIPCINHVYQNHQPPYHVHQPCTITYTIPYTSTMYHTKYINHDTNIAKYVHTNPCTITSLMYLNMYQHHQDMHLIHVPRICLTPCTKDVPQTYTNASTRYQRHDHHIINK